jgi:hypothetical protein
MVLLLTLRMGSRSVLTEAEVELVLWRRGIEPRGESGDRTSARADLKFSVFKLIYTGEALPYMQRQA